MAEASHGAAVGVCALFWRACGRTTTGAAPGRRRETLGMIPTRRRASATPVLRGRHQMAIDGSTRGAASTAARSRDKERTEQATKTRPLARRRIDQGARTLIRNPDRSAIAASETTAKSWRPRRTESGHLDAPQQKHLDPRQPAPAIGETTRPAGQGRAEAAGHRGRLPTIQSYVPASSAPSPAAYSRRQREVATMST